MLEVFISAAADTAFEQIPAAEILVADLSLWQRPPQSKGYTPSGEETEQPRKIGVAVDPVLGRLTFPSGSEPDAVEVGYAYGFSGDVGGGPYDRTELRDGDFMAGVTWQRGVGRAEDPEPGEVVATLTEAIEEWNLTPAGTAGVIAVLDSRTYEETPPTIELKPGSTLLVVAAGWPGTKPRPVGSWVPSSRRSHVRGDLTAVGTNGADDTMSGRLTVEGLLVEGRVRVLAGDLGLLRLADCTVVPSATALVVESSGTPDGDNGALEVELDRTICGGVELAGRGAGAPRDARRLSMQSRRSRPPEPPRGSRGAPSSARRRCAPCTRRTRSSPEGSRPSAGRSVASGSVTSRGSHRRPLHGATGANPTWRSATSRRATRSWSPDGSSRSSPRPTLDTPATRSSASAVPIELRTGADNGSELGVFAFLRQPQREANLRAALDEYLRLGLEAGIVPVT